jgi:hypothetical protein
MKVIGLLGRNRKREASGDTAAFHPGLNEMGLYSRSPGCPDLSHFPGIMADFARHCASPALRPPSYYWESESPGARRALTITACVDGSGLPRG